MHSYGYEIPRAYPVPLLCSDGRNIINISYRYQNPTVHYNSVHRSGTKTGFVFALYSVHKSKSIFHTTADTKPILTFSDRLVEARHFYIFGTSQVYQVPGAWYEILLYQVSYVVATFKTSHLHSYGLERGRRCGSPSLDIVS